MPRLTMMSGPSGSGKSTESRKLLAADGNTVRINRDEIRLMSLHKWTPRREEFIINAEKQLAQAAAKAKYHIIIDDTNLTQKDEDMWRQVAKDIGYTFEKKAVIADIETCVARDAKRPDHQSIGRSAIERQFLRGKLVKWPTDKKIVIFDIDGTLADLTHRTPWIKVGGPCPNCEAKGFFQTGVKDVDYTTDPVTIIYNTEQCSVCEGTGVLRKKHHDKFYSLVYKDAPIDIVVRWAKACYGEFYLLVVSGRSPEKSEVDTLRWLDRQGVLFDHFIMRRANMHGPDTEEKQKILDLLLASGLPKEQIAFVVDDRPSVIEMWKQNGIRVIPVRGRDDDEFYELMNNLEATHPRPDLESSNE